MLPPNVYSATVGPMNVPNEFRKFRAPVVLDASGSVKRLPEEVEWHHIQEGDLLIVLCIGDRPSGGFVLDDLEFWKVTAKNAEDEFEVLYTRFVGFSSGQAIHDRLNELFETNG